MLQKLLIALCTVCVLSACGGDVDLGPSTAPPPDNGGGDGNGDGDGDGGDGDFEPGEPKIYTYIPFDEEADVDAWMSACANGCNASASISWNGTEEVLVAEPTWASDSDQLDIYGAVDEVDDMAGSAASIWVYVTDAYASDGNMTMHLLLSNASGLKGVSRAYPAESGWNRIEMWELAAGTGETVVVDGSEYIDYGTFAWHDQGFSLRDINEVGVRLVANGKAPEVAGPLWFDNVTLTPASGAGGPLIVEADDPAWTVMDATDGVVVQTDDTGVYYEPTAADQKLVYLLEGPVDLVGRSFDMTITVDQAFKDSGADIQPIMQLNFGSYTGEFGCYVGNGSLTAGEPYEINCATENEAFIAEEGQNIRVGLQVKNEVAGRVTINSMQINITTSSGDSGPFALVPAQADIDAGTWDNDNWQNLEGAPDLSIDGDTGTMQIDPNWQATDSDERTIMYVAAVDELPDLEGATVGAELYLSDYYLSENPGMQVQLFIQQSEGSYTGVYGDILALSAGEDLGNGWYRFEQEFEGVPAEPTAQRVGFKLQGAGLSAREEGEPILLRQITIE